MTACRRMAIQRTHRVVLRTAAGEPRILLTAFFLAAGRHLGENLLEILSYSGIVSRYWLWKAAALRMGTAENRDSESDGVSCECRT